MGSWSGLAGGYLSLHVCFCFPYFSFCLPICPFCLYLRVVRPPHFSVALKQAQVHPRSIHICDWERNPVSWAGPLPGKVLHMSCVASALAESTHALGGSPPVAVSAAVLFRFKNSCFLIVCVHNKFCLLMGLGFFLSFGEREFCLIRVFCTNLCCGFSPAVFRLGVLAKFCVPYLNSAKAMSGCFGSENGLLFSLLKYSRNQPCGILYLFKTPSVYSSLPCGPLGIPVAYLSNYSGSFCVFCQVTHSASAGSIFLPTLLPFGDISLSLSHCLATSCPG